MFLVGIMKKFFVYLLLLFVTTNCVKLPEKWKLYLQVVISTHEKVPYPPQVIEPSYITLVDEPSLTPYIHILPSVVVWDVLTQYSHLIQHIGGFLPCVKCGKQLYPKHWYIGQNVFFQSQIVT